MTERQKWAIVWGAWLGYLVTAESIALRGEHPDAPLCAHLRPVLGARRGNAHTAIGLAAYAAGVTWFAGHLFRDWPLRGKK